MAASCARFASCLCGAAKSSRPLGITDEVRRIVARGAREITLLGQIVNSWGRDPRRPSPDLADLLSPVHGLPGLVPLRFLTSHPAWMTDELIATVAALPALPARPCDRATTGENNAWQ